MSRRAGAALLLPWVLLMAALPAVAGPLVVRAPDGSEWRVNEDEETRLERYTPDGRTDPRFGKGGKVAYTLGHADAGTAALRVDAAGRIWLAGTSSAQGTSGPVVMRFLPDGALDTTWGVGGRNSTTPPGQRVLVADLLPQPDGSVWLAGDVLVSPGGQRAALWRLKPDGALDFGFGAGGLWQRPGRERSRAVGLAEAPDGSVALGLQVPEGDTTQREIYLVPSGGEPRALERRPIDEQDDEEDDYLEWAGNAWHWDNRDQVAGISGLAQAAAAPASGEASAATEPGHVGLSPFGTASTPQPPAQVPDQEQPWGLLIGGAAAIAALLALWLWRARSAAKPRR